MALKEREIEFKYPAENINLIEFKSFCEARKPMKFLMISGYDHFYTNEKDPNSFYRHRINTNENQLTFKRKLDDKNNFIREEHNVDLPLAVLEEKISALCGINGYFYDTSIFKNCFIYNYDYYTLVYYICYDKNMTETGRFIEIELKEDYDWANEQEAWSSILALERLCKTIGASPKDRINKSLYEMFRKVA